MSWIIFSVIAVGLLGGLVFFSSKSRVEVGDVNPDVVQAASAANGNIADHTLGVPASKVILTEYGDFQCPYCANEAPLIKQIAEKYSNQITFIFRNFPLTTIHPNGRAAAGAVEAAGLQGKYWDMFDKIYQNQSSWENLTGTDRNDFFVDYAKSLGLNTDTFIKDSASDAVSQKIAFDQAIGKKLGVDSTPTFYLDGVKVEQATWGDATKLSTAIDAELTKNGITPPTTSTTAQ